jgi:hypothetical protein
VINRSREEFTVPTLKGNTLVTVQVDYMSLHDLMEKEIIGEFGRNAFITDDDELWVDNSYGPHREAVFVRKLTKKEIVLFHAMHLVKMHFHEKHWSVQGGK